MATLLKSYNLTTNNKPSQIIYAAKTINKKNTINFHSIFETKDKLETKDGLLADIRSVSRSARLSLWHILLMAAASLPVPALRKRRALISITHCAWVMDWLMLRVWRRTIYLGLAVREALLEDCDKNVGIG